MTDRRGVAGESLGDGVAGEAAHGGDCGVAQHVGRHRGAVGPVEARAGPAEERVVVAGGHRRRGRCGTPVVGVAGGAAAVRAVEQRDEDG